jgi:hypothetical protein
MSYVHVFIPAEHLDATKFASMGMHVDSETLQPVDAPSPTAAGSQASTQKGADTERKEITLYDCLEKFSESEVLESHMCSKCKVQAPPSKKMDLWSTPPVLVIHLKRFQVVPGRYFMQREKLNDIVEYPLEGLDLSNYVLSDGAIEPVKSGDGSSNWAGCRSGRDNATYDLIAVCQHAG